MGPICDVLDDGPWLIGWGAGADHYSWVRFTFSTPSEGSIDLLDSECGSCTDYFGCEGPGLFWIGPANNPLDPQSSTIEMQLPAGCAGPGGTPAKNTLLITKIAPASGFPSKQTVLTADVDDDWYPSLLEGYQYPAPYCDAAFKTCPSPFQ